MGDYKIVKLDRQVLDAVSQYARKSVRKRMNLDLRNSDGDRSQRMLNAIEPGTNLPIHRHTATSETCIVLRGKAVEIFYNYFGDEMERILLEAGGNCPGINIPPGTWHKIQSLESGTVIFEAKDGPYEPLLPVLN